MATPAAKREAVAILVQDHEMSEWRACARRGPDLDTLPQPTTR